MTTPLGDEIRKMKGTAKHYNLDAAASRLGIKPRTLDKWFRTYDINGLNGGVPTDITHETLLWIADRTKLLTIGKAPFYVLDTSKVRRVLGKNGKPVLRVPDLGKWTPRPGEIKRYLVRFPKAWKVEAKNLIDKGYLPIALIAPRLGLAAPKVRHCVHEAKVEAYGVLYDRYAFYDPRLVEAALAGVKPSGQIQVATARTPKPKFFWPGKSEQAKGSVFDAPTTDAEIRKSLVKIPGEATKIMVGALVKAGKYMTAPVSSARLGVHRTTIQVWFRENDERKKSVMLFGRISLYPVALLKEYEAGLKAKTQEKIRRAEKAKAVHSGGSVGELAKTLSRAIRGYKISEGDRKLLVEFGRLMMLDMMVDP